MRRSRTTRHETLRNGALFSFSVAVSDEIYRNGVLIQPSISNRNGFGERMSNSPQHLIAQVRACQRLFAIQQLLRRALEHDSTALVAAFGTHVDDPIGVLDNRQVVLDDHHRISGIHQPIDESEQMANI